MCPPCPPMGVTRAFIFENGCEIVWKISHAVILYQLTFTCYCIISSCFLFVLYSYTIWCIFSQKFHNFQNLMFSAKLFHRSLHNQDIMRHSKSKESALPSRMLIPYMEICAFDKNRKIWLLFAVATKAATAATKATAL